MKKNILLICVLVLVLAFTSCAKNMDNIPSLELVESEPIEWVEERLEGYTSTQLREVWGEPASSMALTPELKSEMWYLSDGVKYIVVIYDDDDGTVEDVVIEGSN